MPRSLVPTAFVAALVTALVGLPALPRAVRAESATLLQDINTSPSDGRVPARDVLAVGGKVFFVTGPPLGEPAVAAADGSGSRLLADLCPGGCDSHATLVGGLGGAALLLANDGQETRLYRSDGTRAGTYALAGLLDPQSLPVLAGDRVYFFRRLAGGGSDPELWVSDGKAGDAGDTAGTHKVPFPAGSSPLPERLAAVGRRLFFRDAHHPGALWASDGTAAGTVLLRDFGADGPDQLIAGATRLYFLTPAGTTWTLWASDGTPGGTRQAGSFLPGPGNLEPGLATIGDRAYLTSDDLVHGQEIWTSDGTPAGVHRVTELDDPNPFGAVAPALAEVSGRLVFATRDGLGSSAGTPASTTLLVKATPQRDPILRAGGRVLFLGAEEDGGLSELWSTDGTAAGTARLDLGCAGRCAVGTLAPFPGTTDAVLFVFGAQGEEIWRSDGTAAGTRRYTDPLPRRILYSSPLAAVGRQLFFLSASETDFVFALWTSDGRPGGTHAVPGFPTADAGSDPLDLTPFGDRLLFSACAGGYLQIWQSDGTPAGTRPFPGVPDTPGCFFRAQITPVGGRFFFWLGVPDQDGLQLWQSDGAGNASGLPAIDRSFHFVAAPLVPLGNEVFFFLPRQDSGADLFHSDGTAAGTRPASEIVAAVPNLASLQVSNGLLFLTASGPDSQKREVWASDGTAAGTRRLLPPVALQTLNAPDFPYFFPVGPRTYFLLTGEAGTEVWGTDGTAAGTARVASGPGYHSLAVLGDTLYLFVDTAASRTLYRVDATGPVLLRQLGPPAPTADFSFPPFSAAVAGRLYFVADDGSHGPALWATDGTAGGTVQVRAFDSVPGFAGLSQLTAAGDRLFFTAYDQVHGIELWESDGTASGTRLAADLAPEAASSVPFLLTAMGSHLFFSADDGLTGRELWSFPLSGAAGCQPGDTRLCLAGNRFQVEVAWKDFQGNAGVGHARGLTPDTGTFWFFAPSNVEAIVKVLDARSLNQAFWVFYGALSSVEYTITVTDTATGLTRRYFNPSGRLASVGDTDGFGPLGAFDTKTFETPASALALVAARTDPRAATGTCTAGPGRLCLAGSRFALTAAWKDFQGHTGSGHAVSLTGDTGYFWFFAPDNVEVVAKVLDGRGLNGKFWLFYGALSNVEYTLTVTDTQTGAIKTYRNPLGQFGSVGDTGAF